MVMPKHKGTDKLKADLRRRISKLREEPSGGKAGAGHNPAFMVAKEGAGQVMVIGPANTGKSALVAALTNARPEVAAFPMSTWTPTPGMLDVEGIQIQLVDTPPLNAEHVEPDLLDLIRRCDLVLLVVDCTTDPMQQIEQTAAFLAEHRIVAQHLRDEYESSLVLFGIPFLVLANKNDDQSTDENVQILRELVGTRWPLVAASTATGRNLDMLKRRLVDSLGLIRVYAKPRGKEADMGTPYVLRKGDTVVAFAAKVHKDFADRLKVAKVWGTGVFDGQLVQRDYVLQDRDVVELHL
jgi:ribosome-interacting GTPase 1